MREDYVTQFPLPGSDIWRKKKNSSTLSVFDLELTARCNNKCRHCYINLPCNDAQAKAKELSFKELKGIIDEAASLGALWCLVTGGEPLLRKDFFEIYLYLKKKGMLVSVFTNARLISAEHVALFNRYPPRDIEVSVYGVTAETYEKITRVPGSFVSFMQGLDLLLAVKAKIYLKTMVLRSNVDEFPEIMRFCQKRAPGNFRFDLFLHLRYDGDKNKNHDITNERLSPQEIVAVEQSDPQRWKAFAKSYQRLVRPEFSRRHSHRLFICGLGQGHFVLSYDGIFRPCSSLWHPDCIYDLKKGTLKDAYQNFILQVRQMQLKNREFMQRCRRCAIVNFCLSCPAHAYLEKKELDTPIDYFCEVAHARVAAVEQQKRLSKQR